MDKIKGIVENFKNFFSTRKGKIITFSVIAVVLIIIGIIIFICTSHNNTQAIQESHNDTQIALDKNALDMVVGDTIQLTASVTSENESSKTVVWSSSDKMVATVCDGLIVAQDSGSATITATTLDGEEDECFIVVTDTLSTTTSSTESTDNSASSENTQSSSSTTSSNNASTSTSNSTSSNSPTVTSVDFNITSKSCKVGNTFTLTANITPSSLSNTALTWTTTNASVATVTSGGVVTTIGVGTAYVRATAPNGQRDTCKVTVTSTTATTSSTSTTSSTTSKSTTSSTTSTPPCPEKKEIVKTIDGCEIWYNPYYRSAQVFVDATSVAIKENWGQDITAKVYKNGVLDNNSSGYYGEVCSNDTAYNVIVCANEIRYGSYFVATPTSFKIVCYHNNIEFKTVQFSVGAYDFA